MWKALTVILYVAAGSKASISRSSLETIVKRIIPDIVLDHISPDSVSSVKYNDKPVQVIIMGGEFRELSKCKVSKKEDDFVVDRSEGNDEYISFVLQFPKIIIEFKKVKITGENIDTVQSWMANPIVECKVRVKTTKNWHGSWDIYLIDAYPRIHGFKLLTDRGNAWTSENEETMKEADKRLKEKISIALETIVKVAIMQDLNAPFYKRWLNSMRLLL